MFGLETFLHFLFSVLFPFFYCFDMGLVQGEDPRFV